MLIDCLFPGYLQIMGKEVSSIEVATVLWNNLASINKCAYFWHGI